MRSTIWVFKPYIQYNIFTDEFMNLRKYFCSLCFVKRLEKLQVVLEYCHILSKSANASTNAYGVFLFVCVTFFPLLPEIFFTCLHMK